MFPNSKFQTRSNNYGLQDLTPMYSQVIQSAPTWSGPFEAPILPPTIQGPQKQSAASFWGGTAAELGSTLGCAALTSTGIGMLACPLVGQVAGKFISNLIQPPPDNNDRSSLYGARSVASNS